MYRMANASSAVQVFRGYGVEKHKGSRGQGFRTDYTVFIMHFCIFVESILSFWLGQNLSETKNDLIQRMIPDKQE